MHMLRVKSRHADETLIELELDSLKYRATTFSIFIIENGKEKRYDGLQVQDIKDVIEVYQGYRALLGERQSVQ